MGTDFHSAMLANAAGEKLFLWEPPCEELDPAKLAINDTDGNAVHLFLGKSTKTAATRAELFVSNIHQIVCRLGFTLDPTGELAALPQPPSCI